MTTASDPRNAAFIDAPGLYLTGEDNLRLTTFGALASAEVALEGRILDKNGCVIPIAERQVPNSNYTAKTTIHGLSEGLLTNVQLRVSVGTAVRGHVFAILELIRGNLQAVQPLGTLIQGYLTSSGRLAWPGSPIVGSSEGPGRLRSVVGTDPAAGVEISETIATGTRARLRSFAYTLVASAVVANRTPVLTIDDGANILFEAGNNVAQTATQTVKYRAAVGVPLTTFGALSYLLPLPSDLELPAGSRIRTVTGAIDVGDNYSAPVYTLEEWIE